MTFGYKRPQTNTNSLLSFRRHSVTGGSWNSYGSSKWLQKCVVEFGVVQPGMLAVSLAIRNKKTEDAAGDGHVTKERWCILEKDKKVQEWTNT